MAMAIAEILNVGLAEDKERDLAALEVANAEAPLSDTEERGVFWIEYEADRESEAEENITMSIFSTSAKLSSKSSSATKTNSVSPVLSKGSKPSSDEKSPSPALTSDLPSAANGSVNIRNKNEDFKISAMAYAISRS
ncbi:hypothetical protein BG004_001905 [Podila humilis]|nr:hypothetical protein BG004_001905 [Podila humilis]